MVIFNGVQFDGPIEEISLARNSITERFVSSLIHTQYLRELRVSETAVGNDFFDVCRAFPELYLLDVRDTKVDDSGLSRVDLLRNLKQLQLSGLKVSTRSLESICRLQHLEVLGLEGTDLTQANLGCLRFAKSLAHLHLAGAKLFC